MTMRSLLFVLAGTAGLLPGQVIAPSGLAGNDGPAVTLVAGFATDGRQQILVDESHLQGLVGTTISGLAFRRDAGSSRALPPGFADLVVTLSIAPHAAAHARSRFDANHDPIVARRTVVFQGQAALPASPSAKGRTVAWTNSLDVVEIRFQNGFAYTGGTLCIEIVGRRDPVQSSSWWPVDAVSDPARGIVTPFGDACGPFSFVHGPTRVRTTLTATPSQLVPGCTVRFTADGNAGQPAALLIGLAPRTPPLPLDAPLPIGGSGCKLYVDAFAAMSGSFAPSRPPIPAGEASFALPVPDDPAVLAARFFVQAVELGRPILTGNALDCTIASAIPSLGLALVYEDLAPTGPAPEYGRVDTTRGPVLRIR
jgi:hypothetical protein